MGWNPISIWVQGTRQNGFAEVAQLGFGLLGAAVYQQSPWGTLVLLLPLVVVYIALSRLAGARAAADVALEQVKTLQGQVQRTSRLASVGAISVNLSHQMKVPLGLLLGQLNDIYDRLDTESRVSSQVRIARDAGRRIDELAHNFITVPQQSPVPFDLRNSLDEALGVVEPRYSNNISIRWDFQDQLPEVEGNPVLMREALSNILSNAMEAMDDGGEVTVEAKQANGSVIASISDAGAGIPAEKLEHIFEPLHLHSIDQIESGLFAAKHILEMHHGNVDVQSVGGEGTRVTVTLPARQPVSDQIQQPRVSGPTPGLQAAD